MYPDYLIGIDGGGTRTRAIVTRADHSVVALGDAGPSALMQGIEQAWRHVDLAVRVALAQAGLPLDRRRCAIALGLSGANNPPWADAFIAADPGYQSLTLDTDAFTMLLGAHGGRPGALVAAGTGSVGTSLLANGSRRSVGGWGFPVGDEGSGAWLGLHAMAVAQHACDGRHPAGPLAEAVWQQVGDTPAALLAWSGRAGQHEWAQLAPLVFDCGNSDPAAESLLSQATCALEEMVRVLDPDGALPLCVSGSVGQRLLQRVDGRIRQRCSAPLADAVHGALSLLHNR